MCIQLIKFNLLVLIQSILKAYYIFSALLYLISVPRTIQKAYPWQQGSSGTEKLKNKIHILTFCDELIDPPNT